MITQLTVVSALALALLIPFEANARPACGAAFSSIAQGLALELFTPEGGFVPGYRDLVEGLRAGSRIRLPNGVEFQIAGVIGGGQLTKILDLGDGWLLRIAAGDGTRRSSNEIEATEPEFIRGTTSFLRVHDELEQAGVPVIEVDRERTHLPFAIVVKKMNFIFEGPEFIAALRHPERSNLSAEVINQAREDFLKFTDRTFMYESIGDFAPRQLGYTGKEWILFDMGDVSQSAHHRPLGSFDSEAFPLKSVNGKDELGKFTLRELPLELETKVGERIRKLRKEAAKSGEWYTREGRAWSALVTSLQPHPLRAGSTLSLSAETSDFRRYTKGVWPGNLPESKIAIRRFVKEKKNVALYEVEIVNGADKFTAQLYLARNTKAEKRILKLREKLEDSPFLSGDDFVIVYQEKDRARLTDRSVKTRPIFR